MENKFYVYQLRLESSENPFYVGKGCGRRIYAHFQERSLKFKNRKNGIIKSAALRGEKVVKEILIADIDEARAYSIEKFLVSKYGRLDIGTGILANHTEGGDGIIGYKQKPFSEEHKRKISASLKGRIPSIEAKLKLSLANTGREVTSETRAKLSKSNSGKIRTDSHCKNISDAVKNIDKVKCEYCDALTSPATHARYHGDKCKHASKENLEKGFINPSSQGSKSNFAKLTEADVISIRASCSDNKTTATLYNVSTETIWRIVNYKTWQHVA